MKYTDEKGQKWVGIKIGLVWSFEGYSDSNSSDSFIFQCVPENFTEGWK